MAWQSSCHVNNFLAWLVCSMRLWYGRAKNKLGNSWIHDCFAMRDVQKLTFAVSPQDCVIGEGSWAGLSFSLSQWSMVAVARSFPKCIDIYDQEIHLRNLRTLYYPSSLTFVQSPYGNESSILVVTEGCQLTMWDLRVKENGGCLKRICGSPGDILYAASFSPTGNIAVGGADRTVTIYDPRRWSATSRWTNCSKYEITGLAFSSVNPDYIYIQGVDYGWSSVESGANAQRSFHSEVTQIGLVSVSVQTEMFLVDGVIRAAYS